MTARAAGVLHKGQGDLFAPGKSAGLADGEERHVLLLCPLEDGQKSASQGLKDIEAAVIEDQVPRPGLACGIVQGDVLLKLAKVGGEPVKIGLLEIDALLTEDLLQVGIELLSADSGVGQEYVVVGDDRPSPVSSPVYGIAGPDQVQIGHRPAANCHIGAVHGEDLSLELGRINHHEILPADARLCAVQIDAFQRDVIPDQLRHGRKPALVQHPDG